MDMDVNKRFLKMGNYFAIYIDLLGQKNLYSGISPSGGAESDNVSRELLQVNYAMRLGYEHLRDFLPKFIKRSDESLNLYRQNGYRKYLKMSESEFRRELESLCFGTQQFSDSLIFYLRDEGRVAGDVFTFIVPLLVLILNPYLAHHVSYRGVVSYGEAWEVKEGVFNGPLLQEMMETEETVVDYPRILVSDGLYSRCKRAKSEYDGINAKDIQDFTGTMLDQFSTDKDRKIILNLHSAPFMKSLQPKEKSYQQDLMLAAQKFLLNSVDRMSPKSPAVAAKYAKAAELNRQQIKAWNGPHIDYAMLGEEYESTDENYEGCQPDLRSYCVLRMAFSSSDALRLDCILTDLYERLVTQNNGFQSLHGIGCYYAGVIVLALTDGAGAKECLQAIGNSFCKDTRTLPLPDVKRKGALVQGIGWDFEGVTICGPVMQKSYQEETESFFEENGIVI